MNALLPYPAYKPAAIPWLQQVPEHWSEMKVKYIFRERVQKGYPNEPLLAATQSMGVVTKETYGERTVTAQKDLHLLKLVERGDFVISLRSFQGGIEISHARGIISPAYTILKVARECHPHYLAYLLKSAPFIDGLKLFITGIREGQNIDYARLARTYLPWPEPAEQHLIVRYLHALDAKVKRYIRAKRSLIARLQEQKQAIIQRAVTRGLAPERSPGAPSGVKLKPSGVEWLGEVPEHWEVLPAKYVFREIDERSRTGREELLSVSHITGVTPRSQKEVTMFMAKTYTGHKVCREGDLVINTMWAWAGALGVSQHVGLVSPAYAVYRPLAKLHLDAYLDLLLRTNSYKDEFFCASTGLRKSRLRMYPEKFFRIGILCPSLEEQQSILDFLASSTRGLDHALQKAQQEVTVMQEYHTRLIADVVTGAVDVTAAAKAMPADQMISGSDDQMMEEEPLSMAAEGEEGYGVEEA